MNDILLLAKSLAKQRHQDQKYGEFPYHVHLDEVEKLASSYGYTARIVAQLHDILEDTSTDLTELHQEFGSCVAMAVSYVTDPDLPERVERKKVLNVRLSMLNEEDEASKLALIVKACDRLANVRASRLFSPERFDNYRHEHPAFKQAVYRKDLCEKIWWELDSLIDVGAYLGRIK